MFVYDEGYSLSCINNVISVLEEKEINVIFIGTKQFGNNLNWLARLNSKERSSLCQAPNSKKIYIDLRDISKIPEKNYFSFLVLLQVMAVFQLLILQANFYQVIDNTLQSQVLSILVKSF